MLVKRMFDTPDVNIALFQKYLTPKRYLGLFTKESYQDYCERATYTHGISPSLIDRYYGFVSTVAEENWGILFPYDKLGVVMDWGILSSPFSISFEGRDFAFKKEFGDIQEFEEAFLSIPAIVTAHFLSENRYNKEMENE